MFNQNSTFGFGSSGDISGGTVSAANSGLSLSSSSTVVLGQTISQSGNPAALLRNTEIPLAGFNMVLTGTGTFAIATSSPSATAKFQVASGISYFGTTNPVGTSNVQIENKLLVGNTEVFTLAGTNMFMSISGITSANINTIQQISLCDGRLLDYAEDGLSVASSNYGVVSLVWHRPGASLTIADNLRSGIVSQFRLGKRPGFSGTTTFAGANIPANGVTTMCSAMEGRLSVDTSGFSALNNLTTTGWFAAVSATISMNTNNTLTNGIWLNTGAGQLALGTITNGYALYINALSSIVTNKFAIYQEGPGDLNWLAGKTGVGTATAAATAKLHLGPGTATAATAPLKFTSGTNMTTAETGAMEYNGTNLFFTLTGTTRQTVMVGSSGATAPTTTAGVVIVNFYGSSATNFLGTPNSWISVVDGATTYKIPVYT